MKKKSQDRNYNLSFRVIDLTLSANILAIFTYENSLLSQWKCMEIGFGIVLMPAAG